MLLSLCFLLISEALPDEESKGYLRREHSIFKGKITTVRLILIIGVACEIRVLRSCVKWLNLICGVLVTYCPFPVQRNSVFF